jgi:hypothetical protein
MPLTRRLLLAALAVCLFAAPATARDERWPEVVAVQQLQENQGRLFFSDRWSTRLVFRLLPCLMRTGSCSGCSARKPGCCRTASCRTGW